MVAMHRRGTFYLVDRKSETVCEVDLGGAEEQKVWAIEAKWSPDGRYIAALVTIGEPPFRSINLMIIDTLTRSRQIDFGGRSVHSIDWSPNGNTLLITVQADPDKTKINLDSFYLVDVTTGDSKLILPEHKFFAAGYYGALWSPDSKTIGLSCSDAVPPDEVAEWRVCIVSVELKP
jgi:dipeptidyl aminopeptidase/acylaminoacyl peptidase